MPGLSMVTSVSDQSPLADRASTPMAFCSAVTEIVDSETVHDAFVLTAWIPCCWLSMVVSAFSAHTGRSSDGLIKINPCFEELGILLL